MSLTKASYAMITGAPVNVKDFGAVGDGVTDDTLALTAAAAALQNNQELFFPSGTYLISYQGTPYSSVYGNVVLNFESKSDISLIGDNATIKVVNHNITTYGGLRFANFKSCHNVLISGFNFNMTFTGVNTSANYYPFCGAITALDDAADGQTQAQLNGDFIVERCTFLLYHPYGSYAKSGTAYDGDPNNGFKVFSFFASGPYLGSTYASQCRNVINRDLIFKNGHNAYGLWIWAWNNWTVENCTAESWVSKVSNADGSYQGPGIPWIRYIQFQCSGVHVMNNTFRAKPCNERLVSGFEGIAIFCDLDTNSTGDYKNGQAEIIGNNIVLGNGDLAHSLLDYGVSIYCYGDVVIQGNLFNGIETTTNACGAQGIYYGAISTGGNGVGSLLIDGNIFGYRCSYVNNIVFSNGSSTSEYERRCKQLTITNNLSLSQLQYFLQMGESATHEGCRQVNISNNIIDGTYNTVYNSSSTNSRAINYWTTNASDQAIISNNQITSKYYGLCQFTGGSLPNYPTIYNNTLAGVTSNQYHNGFAAATDGLSLSNGTTVVLVLTGSGSPESAVAAPVGSLFLRNNGGANTTLYVKESGGGNTGWVAK